MTVPLRMSISEQTYNRDKNKNNKEKKKRNVVCQPFVENSGHTIESHQWARENPEEK